MCITCIEIIRQMTRRLDSTKINDQESVSWKLCVCVCFFYSFFVVDSFSFVVDRDMCLCTSFNSEMRLSISSIFSVMCCPCRYLSVGAVALKISTFSYAVRSFPFFSLSRITSFSLLFFRIFSALFSFSLTHSLSPVPLPFLLNQYYVFFIFIDIFISILM